MSYFSNWIGVFAVFGVPFSALAQQTFTSRTEFPNPGGCRSYDLVVELDCDSGQTRIQCESTESVLQKIQKTPLPGFELHAKCKALHTGDFWTRILEEAVMGASYDGYVLEIEAAESQGPQSKTVTALAPDATSCNGAAVALEELSKQGLPLKAACADQELIVTF